MSELNPRTAEKELLQLPLPFRDSGPVNGLCLYDLKEPHIFDEVKHALNQEVFFSLIHLHCEDEILKCRKAEMLINLQSFDDAVDLLKTTECLLGLGLLSKAYLCLNDYDAFEALVNDYTWLPLSFSQTLDKHDQEGFMHIYNMAANYASRKDNLPLAKLYLEYAETLANDLGLTGRLGVIAGFKTFIYQALGLELKPVEKKPSGNYSSQEFEALSHLLITWTKGEPDLKPPISKAYKMLVTAWKMVQQWQYASAEELVLQQTSKAPDIRVHRGLLGLSLVAHTKREYAGKVSGFLQDIQDGLATYPFKRALLNDIYKLYPLGVLLASDVSPDLKEMSQHVPLLVHESYRDGLRLAKQTIVLPISFRKAWLEDDAFNYRISQKQLLDKSARYRANKKLRKHKIHDCHIVSVVQYYNACQTFAELGYVGFAQKAKELLRQYPKTEKYLF